MLLLNKSYVIIGFNFFLLKVYNHELTLFRIRKLGMFENKSYTKIKRSNDRNFGLIFAAFFMIICLYPILQGQDIKLWACTISFIFLFFGIFFPKALILPNKLWFKFGMLLGTIIAPIIMGIIFILVVSPIGIIMRLLGKDILNQKMEKSSKSYWIKRKENISSLKNQF